MFIFVERIQKPDIQEDGNEQRISSDLFNKDCSTRLNNFFLQIYISLGQCNKTLNGENKCSYNHLRTIFLFWTIGYYIV
jgi:hypothetical protein